MKNSVFGAVALALVAGCASKCPKLSPDVTAITLPGTYVGHLQDIWRTKDGTIWWAHTHKIVRTTPCGEIAAEVDVVGHNAGCEVQDGKLYVAVCDDLRNKEDKTYRKYRVQVNVHDAETLALLETHVVPELNDRAGSLAILPDGTFVVGCLRHPKLKPSQVRFHHLTRDFKPIRSVIVENVTVPMGIETIRYRQGELFLACYNSGKKGGHLVIVLDAKTFAEKRRYAGFNATVGMSFEGDSTTVWQAHTAYDKAIKMHRSDVKRVTLPPEILR